jgi:hypothetical protein
MIFMALGKRKPQQNELFIPTAKLATGLGHPFYTKLNEVLAEAGFDEFVERLCAPYYKEGGRPGIPPGVYFRMLFIGYFEGLDGQRGIAWRCADSLALRSFLGIGITEATPVHASMTIIRQRFASVFVTLRRDKAGATSLPAISSAKRDPAVAPLPSSSHYGATKLARQVGAIKRSIVIHCERRMFLT